MVYSHMLASVHQSPRLPGPSHLPHPPGPSHLLHPPDHSPLPHVPIACSSSVVPRGSRISLTFRKVKRDSCTCGKLNNMQIKSAVVLYNSLHSVYVYFIAFFCEVLDWLYRREDPNSKIACLVLQVYNCHGNWRVLLGNDLFLADYVVT